MDGKTLIVNPRTQLFETPNGGLSIHDVVDNNAEHLEALLDLYRELFPEYLSALPRVREKAFSPVNADPRFVRHQWIVLLNEAPIGLVSFKFAFTGVWGYVLALQSEHGVSFPCMGWLS